MASNSETRHEAIVLHNTMVLDVSNYIFDESLTTVKELFRDNPLTPKDLSKTTDIRHLFDHLMRYEKIAYGEYHFFTSAIKKEFPSQCTKIQEYVDKIKNLKDEPDDKEDLIVQMDHSDIKTTVGSPAFFYCSVKPKPDEVQWAKGQKIPSPEEKILIDNRKYFSGLPGCPTLIINETSKNDESYYQCTANRRKTKKTGDIAHLQVLDGDKARQHSSSQSESIATDRLTSTDNPIESHGPVEMHRHKPKTAESEESSSDTRMIRSRSKSGSYSRSTGRDRGHKSRSDKRKRRSSSHSTKTRHKHQWNTTEPEGSSSDTRMIRSRSKSGSYSPSIGRDRGHKSRFDKRKRRSSR